MAFIKKAANLFSTNLIKTADEPIGVILNTENSKIKIKEKIAEGGFGAVYSGYDVATGKKVAIKRMIAKDETASAAIFYETAVLRQLSSHENIITFISCLNCSASKNKTLPAETYYLITELCTGGEIVDIMKQKGRVFPKSTVLQILFHTCQAIRFMHSQNPPIIHRDIKVENLLVSADSMIKLCDFGSCTTQRYFPDKNWTRAARDELREEIEKKTTPPYRAPEMVDLYQNYPIFEAVDVWSLGCVIYLLCYNAHPFQEAATLAILNADYSFPPGNSELDELQNLICHTFLIDPRQRPRIEDIIGELSTMASWRNIILPGPIKLGDDLLIPPKLATSNIHQPVAPNVHQPRRPTVPLGTSIPVTPTPTPCTNAHSDARWDPEVSKFNSMRASPTAPSYETIKKSDQRPKAASIFPDISDLLANCPDPPATVPGTTDRPLPTTPASEEHVERKQSFTKPQENNLRTKVHSIPKPKGVEIFYITNRLAVSLAQSDAALDALEQHLDTPTSNSTRPYLVFNLTGQRYQPMTRFHGQSVSLKLLASLSKLVEVCTDVIDWLMTSQSNSLGDENNPSLAVLHGSGGRQSAVWRSLACGVLCAVQACQSAQVAIALISQVADDQSTDTTNFLTPSQARYLEYICHIKAPIPCIPHNQIVKLAQLEIYPVPMFNRTKDGCRPYVEVFQGEERFFTSMDSNDIDKIRIYTTCDPRIIISLKDIAVQGDISIVLHHLRGGVGTEAKAVIICQYHFHTGFIPVNTTYLNISKSEIDILGPADRYAPTFCMGLECSVTANQLLPSSSSQPWQSSTFRNAVPLLLTSYVPQNSSEDHAHETSHTSAESSRDPIDSLSDSDDDNMRQGDYTAPVQPPQEPEVADLLGDANDLYIPLNETTSGWVPDWSSTEPPPAPSNPPAETQDEIGVEILLDILGDSSAPGQPARPSSTTPSTNEHIYSTPFHAGSTSNVNLLTGDAQLPTDSSQVPFNDPFLDSASMDNGDTAANLRRSHTTGFMNQPQAPSSTQQQSPWGKETPFGAAGVPPSSKNPFDDLGDFGHNKKKPTLNDLNSGTGSSRTSPTFKQKSQHPKPPSPKPPIFKKPDFTNASTASSSANSTGEPNPKPAPTVPPKNPFDTSFGPGGSSGFFSTNGGGVFTDQTSKNGVFTNKGASSSSSAGGGVFTNKTAGPSGPSGFQNQQQFRNPPSSTPGSSPFGSNPSFSTGPSAGVFTNKGPTSGGGVFTNESSSGFTNNGFGTNPRASRNPFEDLLGEDFKAYDSDPGGKSLHQLKREAGGKTMDPDKLKVMQWTEGKQRNIRALLCSLEGLLWEGVRWPGLNMAQLMSVDTVKKQYRNIVRVVHPDKWMGTPYENIARLIVVELNDAMAEFEKEKEAALANSRGQNLFS